MKIHANFTGKIVIKKTSNREWQSYYILIPHLDARDMIQKFGDINGKRVKVLIED